jgi:hypothetical protein
MVNEFNLNGDKLCGQHFTKLSYFNEFVTMQCVGTPIPANAVLQVQTENGPQTVTHPMDVQDADECARYCLSTFYEPEKSHCWAFELSGTTCKLYTAVQHAKRAMSNSVSCYARKELGDLCGTKVGSFVRDASQVVYYVDENHEFRRLDSPDVECNTKKIYAGPDQLLCDASGKSPDPACQSCIETAHPTKAFTCADYHVKRLIKCQLSSLRANELKCPGGKGINVIYANYGRTSVDECQKTPSELEALECKDDAAIEQWETKSATFEREQQCLPATPTTFETSKTNCLDTVTAKKVMMHMCQGSTTCAITGGLHVNDYNFGNPCPNVFKYLEVEYSCKEIKQS